MIDLIVEYWRFMPIILTFVPLFICFGTMYLCSIFNISFKVASVINLLMYIHVFILLFDIIPLQISSFWDKINLGPKIIDWIWGFIPTINPWTIFKLTYEFCYKIFLPCASFLLGIKYGILDLWNMKKEY